MRAYKTVNDTYIEPISFTVPRRAEVFQADIYPPATGVKPAVSAAEWLSGKDGIPAKISLESIYDGNAPVEVSADYKPPTQTPAPTPNLSKPTPAKAEPEPTPMQRAPPSIPEQKASIAAMTNKYHDQEASDDEADETSSFEEIAKPVTKSMPAAAKVDAKSASPTIVSPTKTHPPRPVPVSQATPRSSQTPTTPTPTTIPTSSGPISAVGSAPSDNSSNAAVEASLAQIKNMLETQTKTITAQSEKISQLTQEVDTLKMKVGSGSQGQSERIRQLELELEAARS